MSINSTPSTRKKRKSGVLSNSDFYLRCLSCGFDTGTRNKKPFPITGYLRHDGKKNPDPFGRIKSPPLCRHITQTESCKSYYVANGLCRESANQDRSRFEYDLTSSVIARTINGVTESVPHHQVYEPGAIGIRCPSSSTNVSHQFHSTLNNQTVFNPVLPMEKSTLQSITRTYKENNTASNMQEEEDSARNRRPTAKANAQEETTTRTFTPNSPSSKEKGNSTTNSESNINEDNSSVEEDNTNLMDFSDSDIVVTVPDHDENNEHNHQPSNHKTNTPFHMVLDTTKGPTTLMPPSREMVELELMNLMTQHKMPLQCFASIWKWAHKSEKRDGFSFKNEHAEVPRKRSTILDSLRVYVDRGEDVFQEKTVHNWLPGKDAVAVQVRDFRAALKSLLENTDLMKEENLSFPDPSVPYIWNGFDSPDCEISELHHGKWWVDSWAQAFDLKEKHVCDSVELKEVLVPIILYMDGISLDSRGRLKLTPLNMSLGILNTEARKRADAWETLYFHPDSDTVQIACNTKKPTPEEAAKNLHAGLNVGLQSFFDVCEDPNGINWKGLPYGGKTWNVRMKFAIAYVIGDTELHDALCGRFKSYNANVKKLCRHCNISSENLVKPECQHTARLWNPSDFEPTKGDTAYFKSVSHHPLVNAFNRLDFGVNRHKIHLASPGELLHMHQLGCNKRAVEAFVRLVGPPQQNDKTEDKNEKKQGENQDETNNQSEKEKEKKKKKTKKKKNKPHPNGSKAQENLGLLAQRYGQVLSRQSNRNFPRTKFSSVHILNTSMKEGNHYAGILLCIMITLFSTLGQYNLKTNASHVTDKDVIGQIETIEMLLQMEEFLKYGGIKRSELPKLRSVVDLFIGLITLNCRRTDNEDDDYGTRLVKNHLYFHLFLYILYFGAIAGWDSSSSESNHKTEIKAPSKNTQSRALTLIKQTAQRQSELRLLRHLKRAYKLEDDKAENPSVDATHGPKFFIQKEGTTPKMLWRDARHSHLPTHSAEVIKYVTDKVLPHVNPPDGKIPGFTQHERRGEENQVKYIYRAHPSFRGESNQSCNSWYDWANVDIDHNPEKPYPCQLLCFIQIEEEMVPTQKPIIDGCEITAGVYAIVRRFEKPPEPIVLKQMKEEDTTDTPSGTSKARKRSKQGRTFTSSIVKVGTAKDCLTIVPCDAIVGDVAVVPDFYMRVEGRLESKNRFFVVEDSVEWHSQFLDRVRNAKPKPGTYSI